MTRKLWLLLAVIFTVFSCASCFSCHYLVREPDRRLERLLGGDSSITVRSFVIDSQQDQPTVIRDPESVEYLTNALRKAVREGRIPTRGGGTPYTLAVDFGSWHVASTAVIARHDLPGFYVAYVPGMMGDSIWYWIELNEPVPRSVARAFAELRAVGNEKPSDLRKATGLSRPTTR